MRTVLVYLGGMVLLLLLPVGGVGPVSPSKAPAAALAQSRHGPITDSFLQESRLSSTDQPLSLEQEKLVAWARWRFEAAGLDLPAVHVEFQQSTLTCGGREGLYHPPSGTVYLCTTRNQTLLHELAHAWTDQRLSDVQRMAFVEFRHLAGWNRREDPWELRGTEQASEIITWALMDRPTHVPTTGPHGEIVFHLLSIPDSDVDSIALAYQLLTGTHPPFRDPSEWAGILDVGNPELRYVIR